MGRRYEEKNHPWRIIKFIIENPGVHFRKIMRQLGISSGSLANTIQLLESNQVIIAKYVGCQKLFYSTTLKEIPKSPLTPAARKVYDSIDENPGSTLKDLGGKLGFTRQNIRYHTQNLEERGDIRSGWNGKSLIFFIK